jgi:hypothetical protein
MRAEGVGYEGKYDVKVNRVGYVDVMIIVSKY